MSSSTPSEEAGPSEVLVVPEITVTNSSPSVKRKALRLPTEAPTYPIDVRLQDESRFTSITMPSTSSGSSSDRFENANRMQYLRPDTTSTEESTEFTPLLQGERTRKRSFGYRDKRFDEDVLSQAELVPEPKPPHWILKYLKMVKTAGLSAIVVICVVIYTLVQEHPLSFQQFSISKDADVIVPLNEHMKPPSIRVSVFGAFLQNEPIDDESEIFVSSLLVTYPNGTVVKVAEDDVSIVPKEHLETFPESQLNFVYDLADFYTGDEEFSLRLSTDKESSFPFAMKVTDLRGQAEYGIIYAAAILAGMYVLIIFEIVHRTLASMLAATASISVLSQMNDKPTLDQIVQWIDIETLCLLFGMMVLVAILCETGFFDYAAVVAYRFAKGNSWTLMTLLCLTTAVISAFLDNVTTILLFTPVTIRLCEVMHLNPKDVLIALVVFSNVGGTATAVGDPPNVIIVSNSEISKAGIEFTNFTIHMGLGVIFVMVGTYGFIYIMYHTCIRLQPDDQPEAAEIKQEIQVWRRTAKSLSLYSRDENTVRKMLIQKVDMLENTLKKKLYNIKTTEDDYKASLIELEKNYKIHDWPLLIKTGVVLFLVILMFFLHSIPGMNISLGWIALMGALLLLILSDFEDVEQLFGWVEWSTLIFFAALFVVMEVVTRLGLLEYIGGETETFILGLDENARLPVSIVLVLWVSAIASSFIDNIPFTTVMLKIVLKLGHNATLGLPLQPLVWALAFGACLGGNGTLIGASANVVCAGVAEQHGYRFTFLDFFKVGFPTMLVTTTIAMIYLLICHVFFEWNT